MKMTRKDYFFVILLGLIISLLLEIQYPEWTIWESTFMMIVGVVVADLGAYIINGFK